MHSEAAEGIRESRTLEPRGDSNKSGTKSIGVDDGCLEDTILGVTMPGVFGIGTLLDRRPLWMIEGVGCGFLGAGILQENMRY